MRTFKLLLPVVLVVCVSIVQADTILVPFQQPTIQAGIDAAVDGDTVLVADGTYTGDGNRDIDFNGKAIVVMSENGAENCVIDCEEGGRGFYFHSGEDSRSVVQGFTIQHGIVYGWYPQGCGGAFFCESSSSPTIINNTITGNTAYYQGGGIYCSFSSPTIRGNKISRNSVGYGGLGGGIYCDNSSAVIIGNTITGNVAVGDWFYGGGLGGGIYCAESSPIITDNTITGNNAYNYDFGGRGGGIYCGESSPIIIGNTITGNTASPPPFAYGGGICGPGSSTIITNSILWGNSPEEIVGTPQVTYSNIQGGFPGEGNIDEDPMFVIPGDSVTYGDYRLLWGSPCIDTGHPHPLLNDPDGTRSDMGVHYFNQNDYLTLYITPDMTEVPPGGQLGVTYTAINRWNWSQPFWALSAVKPAGGTLDIILGPDKYKLPANYTAQVHTVYNVPPDAPQGVYEYLSAVGMPPATLYDWDSFKYRVKE